MLTLVSVCPIVDQTDSAEATFVPSTTSITIATGQASASVDITPSDKNGTFAKSENTSASPNNTTASFDVTTNNYTGYTLKLLGNDATGNLTNASYSDTLASITTAINQSTFESGSSYTNKWGIRPSVVNSASNTDYYPAPTTTSEIPIETTSVANSTAKNYNINVGAKVDYTKAAGTYTNTFTLVAVGNATSFTITYDKGGISDTVTNLPGNTTGTTDGTYATLSSTVPQRTGYTFAGWCNGTLSGTTANPGTTCTGTLITDGKFDLNQTTSNTVPLHATWTANKYTCTKQYRLQNADSSWGSYTTDSTEQVAYNNTCSYNNKSVTDYKAGSASAANGASGSTSCIVTTSGCVASLSFYRNTYALTVSRNSTYISAASASTTPVHGTNYYRWGQSVAISATTNYSNFTKWTLTDASGSQISTAASTNYTMPKANTTIYANGDRPNMSNFTNSTCSTRAASQNIWVYDPRDSQYYTVRYINGNCWMTKNLAIGCSGSSRVNRDLTSSNSNVSVSWSTSSALSLDKTDNTTNCTTSNTSDCNSYTTSRMKCDTTNGAWYNYKAATGGYITGSSDTREASYSICPLNWKLPSYSDQTSILSYSNAYAPTKSKAYYDGAVADTSGYWWSSTTGNDASSAVTRFTMYWNGSTLSTGSQWRSRDNGFAIRCIRNS